MAFLCYIYWKYVNWQCWLCSVKQHTDNKDSGNSQLTIYWYISRGVTEEFCNVKLYKRGCRNVVSWGVQVFSNNVMNADLSSSNLPTLQSYTLPANIYYIVMVKLYVYSIRTELSLNVFLNTEKDTGTALWISHSFWVLHLRDNFICFFELWLAKANYHFDKHLKLLLNSSA